jgi:hypothetical protein
LSVSTDAALWGIPEADRTTFSNAIRNFADAQIRGDWDYVYHNNVPLNRSSRKQFVRREREHAKSERLLSFEVQSAGELEIGVHRDPGWQIDGCGSFLIRGEVKQMRATALAMRKGQKWFFSPIRMQHEVDGSPIPCPNT